MRLTWNSNGWQYPSGRSWNNKVQSPANHAYEHVHGYGFEEWLFNPRYSKDGIVYGYINGAERVSIETEIIPKAYLYTIEGVTKQRILLGYIENLSIIWEEEDIITGRKSVHDLRSRRCVGRQARTDQRTACRRRSLRSSLGSGILPRPPRAFSACRG